jgi:hypothetical protein
MACPAKDWARQESCLPGYYSTIGMMHCQISPYGYFAANTESDPVECANGYFADVGHTYCVQCPPGHQCKDKSGRHNVICKPGFFANGDGLCTICEAGKQCPLAISGYITGGLDCPAGTYAPEGSFDCELCKPGMDCSVDAT